MSLQDVLEQEQVWNDVVATITPLPNITVYNMETWEWTVVSTLRMLLDVAVVCCSRL